MQPLRENQPCFGCARSDDRIRSRSYALGRGQPSAGASVGGAGLLDLGVRQELRTTSVGAAILTGAGGGYVTQLYIAAALGLALPVSALYI